jgi:hypothetical protein
MHFPVFSQLARKLGFRDEFALPLISGRIGGHYELTPPVVPVRTFFCRSRTRYLLARNFPLTPERLLEMVRRQSQ